MLWAPEQTARSDGWQQEVWTCFVCTSCGGVTSTRSKSAGDGTRVISNIYPEPKAAHSDIPDTARRFLQQAIETLHAPDAAAVMAGSAVDSMLKSLGYDGGSVYSRIEKAVGDNVLTQNMGEWAHSVRLGSNRPRHADAEQPHVSPAEAKRSVEFAEALGQFLFVLKAQIDRALAQAEAAKSA